MEPTAREIIERADQALADITDGNGRLLPKQADSFLQDVFDDPVLANISRKVKMTTPEEEQPTIGFGSRIFQAPPADHTELAVGSRAKADFGKLVLSAKDYQGDVRIPKKLFRDNIERERLNSTLLGLFGKALARDMSVAFFQGDTAVVDADAPTQAFLRVQDGILKKIVSHVVDVSDVMSEDVMDALMRVVPGKYIADEAEWRLLSHRKACLDWKKLLAARGTPGGDKVLWSAGYPPYGVTPVLAEPFIPTVTAGAPPVQTTQMLLVNPKNLVIGIYQDISFEKEIRIREQDVVFVMTTSVAFAIEREDACAKATNIVTTG